MSDNSGIPISTLSKVEHERLTLTYDKLHQLTRGLGMRMSDLFAELDRSPPQANGRRSIGDRQSAVRVETPNYDYHYLCTELRQKRMLPVAITIRAKTLEEFGDLVRHPGEEYIYVLTGRVVVASEFYDPVMLEEGQSIYIDSTMGHAYLAGDGCDQAEILAIMSSEEQEQMRSLLTLHEERRAIGRRHGPAEFRPEPTRVAAGLGRNAPRPRGKRAGGE